MLISMYMNANRPVYVLFLCQQFRRQLKLEDVSGLRVISVIFLLLLIAPFLLGFLRLLFGEIGIDLDSNLQKEQCLSV